MPNHNFKGNYLFLLAGLSLLLISYPAFLELKESIGVIAIHIATSVTLIISVWTLIGKKRWFIFGMFLTTALLILTLVDLFYSDELLNFARIGISFLFFSLTLFITFHDVVFNERTDSNRIIGAICIYLLFGILWSISYNVVTILSPNSFKGLTPSSSEHQGAELLYFSFVTLTTLGYGDIAPIKPLARTLAYFEAIIGQFYLAIMVAGLVGAHISQKKKA